MLNWTMPKRQRTVGIQMIQITIVMKTNFRDETLSIHLMYNLCQRYIFIPYYILIGIYSKYGVLILLIDC